MSTLEEINFYISDIMNSIWIYLLYGTLIVAMKKEGKIAMAVKKDNTAKGVLSKL